MGPVGFARQPLRHGARGTESDAWSNGPRLGERPPPLPIAAESDALRHLDRALVGNPWSRIPQALRYRIPAPTWIAK